MTILRPEAAVVSELLCGLPDARPKDRRDLGSTLLRALDLVPELPDDATDFGASLASGFVETDCDRWAAGFPWGAA
jgi:hypothetical protein